MATPPIDVAPQQPPLNDIAVPFGLMSLTARDEVLRYLGTVVVNRALEVNSACAATMDEAALKGLQGEAGDALLKQAQNDCASMGGSLLVCAAPPVRTDAGSLQHGQYPLQSCNFLDASWTPAMKKDLRSKVAADVGAKMALGDDVVAADLLAILERMSGRKGAAAVMSDQPSPDAGVSSFLDALAGAVVPEALAAVGETARLNAIGALENTKLKTMRMRKEAAAVATGLVHNRFDDKGQKYAGALQFVRILDDITSTSGVGSAVAGLGAMLPVPAFVGGLNRAALITQIGQAACCILCIVLCVVLIIHFARK